MHIQSKLLPLRVVCSALMGGTLAFLLLPLLFVEQELPAAALPNTPLWALVPAAFIVASFLAKRAVGQKLQFLAKGSSKAAIDLYFSATLMAFALREGSVLAAFVLSFLTGEFGWFYAAPPAALLAMVADWPTVEKFNAWAGVRWQDEHHVRANPR